jgi:WD40-like Beta Propeller Repeat
VALPFDFPPAWLGGSFVFVAGNRDGMMLWRQRFVPESFEMVGPLEPLTHGMESASWPSAAANRLAFVGMHPDYNLWSVPVDSITGAAAGPPQRVTRGPGLMGQLSLSRDGKRLVYFSNRARKPEFFLRDLEHATERVLTAELINAMKQYPALSPSGSQLAHGTVVPGPRALRPIVVVDLASGTSRQLSEDSGICLDHRRGGGKPSVLVRRRATPVFPSGRAKQRFPLRHASTPY